MADHPFISWAEEGKACSSMWRSVSGAEPPRHVVVADDTMKADVAYRLASKGTALLWRGDFQNARQLLIAMSRRADRKPRKKSVLPSEAFNLHRQSQSQRSRILSMILVPLDSNLSIPLRRAPDVFDACTEVYGAGCEPSVVALRELLGLIGAHQWRKKGVEIPSLGGHIHPHYGVFSPVRGEYVQLVNEAPFPRAYPSPSLAFDIGTGTGVLAAVLVRRGIKHVVATDIDRRSLECARENIVRLGLSGNVEVLQANLFPAGRAPLIVCNPPWIPARPSTPIEHAIYDPGSCMLRGFIAGLPAHLEADGEGWLVLSDFAEHLGLRTRKELLADFDAAGLKVIGRIDVKPSHPKVFDSADPLHMARAAEVTSLWRLAIS